MENQSVVSDEQMTLMAIQAHIEELPPEIREQIESCASVLRGFITMYADAGKLALALVGAEATVEATEKS